MCERCSPDTCELCARRRSDIVASQIVGHLICWRCYVAAKEMSNAKH